MNNDFIVNVSILICYENKFLFIKRSATESVFLCYWGESWVEKWSILIYH